MEFYYFDLAISCVAGLFTIFGVLSLLFFSHLNKKEKVNKSVILSLYLVILLLGLLTRYYFARLTKYRVTFYLSNAMIVASVWLIFMLILGVFDISGIQDKPRKISFIILLSLSVAESVLAVVNCFIPFMFTVGEIGLQILSGMIALYVIDGLLFLGGLTLIIIKGKSMLKQDIVSYACLFVFYALSVVLDSLLQNVNFYAIFGILGIFIVLAMERYKLETRLNKERAETERLRRDVSRSQVQILQSQVSPHFIYNALTAIQALPNNPTLTKKAIGDFAKYLRQTLTTNSENELIPFEKELENVQAYLRVEKIRFGSELNIVYDIQEKNFEIPALCVQILAENAVKHGVSVKRGGGTVVISTKRQENNIIITISDDGVGFDPVKTLDPTHVGINNVKNRIASLCSGSVNIESVIGSGTTAQITIPFVDKDD